MNRKNLLIELIIAIVAYALALLVITILVKASAGGNLIAYGCLGAETALFIIGMHMGFQARKTMWLPLWLALLTGGAFFAFPYIAIPALWLRDRLLFGKNKKEELT